MKCFQIIILLIFISSCKLNYEGIKRLETQVDYRRYFYRKPIIKKKWKRKIEYRIYDKNEKLIEIGGYGERGGHVQSKWNPIDSSLEIKSFSFRNYKKLDFIEYYKYDDKDRVIERSVFRCRNNKIKYFEDQYIFNYETDSTTYINYKENGEIWSLKKYKLETPSVLEDEIYNQKNTNIGTRIVRTEKQDFIYDDKNRLIKILHKDKNDNLLGYTKYKYIRLKKKRTR